MIQITNLTKHYGQHTALRQLNLSIPAGKIFSLLGSNGAGKSTTLKLLLNFIQPDSGKALVNGVDVHMQPQEARSHIAYIPEQVALYPYLSAWENLKFFTRLSGLKYTREEGEEWLHKAGFPLPRIDIAASDMSKGMRQKVAIAIMLSRKAPCFLMDEPMSGLDPKSANDLNELFISLAESGKTILMATHDLYRAKDCAHQIGIMRDGELKTILNAAEHSHRALNDQYMDLMIAE